jgi:hypothetical protein
LPLPEQDHLIAHRHALHVTACRLEEIAEERAACRVDQEAEPIDGLARRPGQDPVDVVGNGDISEREWRLGWAAEGR